MRQQLYIPAMVLALLLPACARTSMTSIPAPELRGRAFRNILVAAAIGDLGLRQDMEVRLASRTAPAQVRFVPSHQVLYPGRTYSPDETASILRQNQIDAVLVITPGDAGATSAYVPPTYSSGCTMWSPQSGCTRVTTTTTGGYTLNRPWASFTAQLYDANSGAVVWVATATTGGNAYASAHTLVRSMADKTVAQLARDRVIVR